MKVHHLSCGTMCPIGGSLWDGFSHGLTSKLVCHTLAIETESAGLVLVDTGFGLEDMRSHGARLSKFFVVSNNIKFDEEQSAIRQIEKLGFKKEDVQHIILTHLDFDHAGGLTDFPDAKIHLLSDELEYAMNPKSWRDRNRFSQAQMQFAKWKTYREGGQRWYGFDSVRDLEGLPPEILLVPLRGHTHGHTGVAICDNDRWLLHAGDAYFYRGEMDPQEYQCTPALRAYQTMMEADRMSRITNQHRLRKLAKKYSSEIDLFSSHDAIELQFHLEMERESFPGLHADPKFPNLVHGNGLQV
jgi:glyoxylase-like metal-dependent hydrolase (beta-lactamase superfamily II)